MKVAQHSVAAIAGLLRAGDLLLDIHPFVARLRSDVEALARDIHSMYGEFSLVTPDRFADFHVEVALERGVRRWVKPLARFYYDGQPSFTALDAGQAFPMIEWGLNWCVAAHSHQFLVVHAAVIEKNGRSAVMPAPPGSGKSTLCAGLVQRGWRLLSDELALFDLATGMVHGMSRPVSLKNTSIDLIRAFAPEAKLTIPVRNTTKGTVALMRPPAESVQRVTEPARPTWIILPKYAANAPATLVPHDKGRSFMLVAEQSFNYDILGLHGFQAVGRLVRQCDCYAFSYSQLDDAVRVFEALFAD